MKAILDYIKSEYKIWLISLALLPLLIIFAKSFKKLESIAPIYVICSLYILMIVFAVSFMVFGIFSNADTFNRETDYREFEKEGSDRFNRNMKKSLLIFTAADIIWISINLYMVFSKINPGDLSALLCVLTLPVLINIFMLVIYKYK